MRRGWITPEQKCFQFMLETREVHVLSCGDKLFLTRGPAALELRNYDDV